MDWLRFIAGIWGQHCNKAMHTNCSTGSAPNFSQPIDYREKDIRFSQFLISFLIKASFPFLIYFLLQLHNNSNCSFYSRADICNISVWPSEMSNGNVHPNANGNRLPPRSPAKSAKSQASSSNATMSPSKVSLDLSLIHLSFI